MFTEGGWSRAETKGGEYSEWGFKYVEHGVLIKMEKLKRKLRAGIRLKTKPKIRWMPQARGAKWRIKVNPYVAGSGSLCLRDQV